MLPDEVREALDALASDVFDGHVAAKRNVQTIRAHLLAREAEVERLQKIEKERWDVVATRNAAVMRAERASALLRECRRFVAWASERLPEAMPTYEQLDAHLSENSRG